MTSEVATQPSLLVEKRIMMTMLSIIFYCLMPATLVAFSSPRHPMQFQSLHSHQSESDFGVVHTYENIEAPHHNNSNRRDFLRLSSAIASLIPLAVSAEETEYMYQRSSSGSEDGDLTSRLFNPDGSLRDPNIIVEAQERTVTMSFPTSVATDVFTISTDGSQPSTESKGLQVSYKVPTKWNSDPSSQLPLYYDSSEGKNGKSCNRITTYTVTASQLDSKVLEKASKIGVAKSLLMDKLPNTYFDRGVMKADLISGRTTRKPIKDGDVIDEQIYYEFDLAFAPLECPAYEEGNKENLGLGFCPYDSIYLVSATVLESEGTLAVGVVECNKDEWKIANSDLKRVRSSFEVNRA